EQLLVRNFGCSVFAQQQVQHPATTNMHSRLAAVVQDVGVVAACIFKAVGKDGEAGRVKRPRRQDAVVVSGCSQSKDRGGLPCGVDGDGAEGMVKDVKDEGDLGDMLGIFRCASQELDRISSGVGCIPRIIATPVDRYQGGKGGIE